MTSALRVSSLTLLKSSQPFGASKRITGTEASFLPSIESYGGILVFVPHKHALGIHHELSQIIGYSKLQLLSEHLGNNSIEVPMATTITIAMRNRTIREMAARKESRSKIARKFGVTIRTIRSIVNGEEKLKFHLDQNLDLFE